MIEVLSSGALNAVQDSGRPGYFDLGVSRCGAMDDLALAVGNALLGNAAEDAGIEVALFPFRLRFHRETAFAITGADCAATLDGVPIPPCWARPARAGQLLVLGTPRSGVRAYLTFRGGIQVAPVLGSRSTDQKGSFGGFAGRGLSRGDKLPLGETPNGARAFAPAGFGASLAQFGGRQVPEAAGTCVLRVLPAAEHAAFTPEARRAFAATDWLLTPEANRMGYRLSGPALTLLQPLELFSHGLVPGTVQVPPSGQPIIQLADANTCGGYPKIATVIEADLWRLAQVPVGSRLRFVEIGRDTALEALRERACRLAALRVTAALMTKRG